MTPATDQTGGSALRAIHIREPSSSHSSRSEPLLRPERLLMALIPRDTQRLVTLSGKPRLSSLSAAPACSINPL